MKSRWPLVFLLFLASAHAQMYKWVDAFGKVTYSDQPPPASVKAQRTAIATGGADNSNLPYALSQAVKNNPVTLYSASSCAPCDEGRTQLKNRGIPFTEKTVSNNADVKQMKQAGGDGRLPFLTVGGNPQIGYDASAWDAALTAAGYPESSQLPANYRYAPAQAAAPVVPSDGTPAETKKMPVRRSPPTESNAPPGFRF